MKIDFENLVYSTHLGRISEILREWEGRIADELGLKPSDVAAIRMKYPFDLKLQTYGTGYSTEQNYYIRIRILLKFQERSTATMEAKAW